MAASDFFSQYAPFAQRVSRTTGIDPRIVLAQAALETGYGQSAPNFNLFGIKGKGATLQTKEFVNGGLIDMPQEFRTYESPEESFLDYARLMSGKRYEGVRSGSTLEEQIAALQKSGYATDPDYGKKIMQIAKGINLEGLSMNGNTTQQVGAPLSMNPPQPQQQSGGLLSGILGNQGSISGGILGRLGMDEDQADRFRMAILAGTGDARMAPLIQATQARMQERKALRDVNKTVDWLRQNVSEEVAQAVANNPGIASNVMSSVLAQRLRPTEAKSSSMIMTGAEIMQIMPGITDLNPSAPYTVKRKDGQITDIDAVGGVVTEPSAFQLEREKSDVKELSEYRKVGTTASRSKMQINRLSELLDRSDTGVIAGLGSLAAQFGVDFRGDAAAAAEAIIAQLVPQQRPPGSGVISDKDLELYKASLPRISNRPGGNKLIIESMIALVEHDIKVGEIAQKALNEEITPAEAYAQMSALADPFASVKPFYGAAPDSETLTREGAMDVLRDAGIIDTDGK